jgi:aminoglycoside/choline kinase family phosphotransferase
MVERVKNEYELFVREALGLPETADIRLTLIFQGGSDRVFYRVQTDGGTSAVLMHYSPERRENNYYATIAGFLRNIGVTAPAVIRSDPGNKFILMEDLGEADLWSFRNDPWDERRALYRDTLALADRLHSFALEDFPSDTVPLMEEFGPALYRWERDYFRENFVERICRIKLGSEETDKLEKELASLARRVHDGARALVHRDLQSRNVMICRGVPVLIDFQGMRPGSPFYDLGSLLYDPYVFFTAEERLELLSYHYVLSNRALDWKGFRKAFHEASAQRLMQALGAYGFLGMKRGLSDFLEHIPRGLDNLIDAAGRVRNLPRLRELALRCREIIQSSTFRVQSYEKGFEGSRIQGFE